MNSFTVIQTQKGVKYQLSIDLLNGLNLHEESWNDQDLR